MGTIHSPDTSGGDGLPESATINRIYRRLRAAAQEELGHPVTLRFEIFDDGDVDAVAKRRYGPTAEARIEYDADTDRFIAKYAEWTDDADDPEVYVERVVSVPSSN